MKSRIKSSCRSTINDTSVFQKRISYRLWLKINLVLNCWSMLRFANGEKLISSYWLSTEFYCPSNFVLGQSTWNKLITFKFASEWSQVVLPKLKVCSWNQLSFCYAQYHKKNLQAFKGPSLELNQQTSQLYCVNILLYTY